MANATVTTDLEINDPTCEVVVLTVTDGEEYVSRKFSDIEAATISPNEDVGTSVPYAEFSGGTALIGCTNVTDKKMTLVLYGRR